MSEKKHLPIAYHIIANFHGVDAKLLNNLGRLVEIFVGAAKAAGMSVISASAYQHRPQGISLTVQVEESHVSVYTWPEYYYNCLDILVCGDAEKAANKALIYIQKRLKPKEVDIKTEEVGAKQNV